MSRNKLRDSQIMAAKKTNVPVACTFKLCNSTWFIESVSKFESRPNSHKVNLFLFIFIFLAFSILTCTLFSLGLSEALHNIIIHEHLEHFLLIRV